MTLNINQTSDFPNSDTFLLQTFWSALTAPCILLLFISRFSSNSIPCFLILFCVTSTQLSLHENTSLLFRLSVQGASWIGGHHSRKQQPKKHYFRNLHTNTMHTGGYDR